MKPRVLLVAETTGYQVRSFGKAADRVGVELVLATDRCHVLDDPWRDSAIPIRFDDEVDAAHTIKDGIGDRPVDGVLAVGDRPAGIAAVAAAALGLRASSPEAVRRAGNKLLTRERLRDARLPCPWFTSVELDETVQDVAPRVMFPCVVKPLSMSGSRGVMRVNTTDELEEALGRARRLLCLPEVRARRDPAMAAILVEQYLPGREVAVEGVLTGRQLQTLAIFDKPDPLEGPFFEETIYVTPSALSEARRADVREAVVRAAAALGLTDGPVHAECRINEADVFVLEVAARPIGGLCSKCLRFTTPSGEAASLEDVLLRHAVGRSVVAYQREAPAAGVMMIPIPGDGLYKGVTGVDDARAVDGVDEVIITAKRDQRIQPLPEGGSYLGFIFARAADVGRVVAALKAAHAFLRFEIAPQIPVVDSGRGRD